MKRAVMLVGFLVCAVANVGVAEMRVERLRCEYLANPLGVDVLQPRLSWELRSDERSQKQTAYRVLVASSEEKLAADQGDLWDSGKVDSPETIHVAYAGTPLASRMRCHWKIQAWDKDGRPSEWSKPALWSMGLLAPDDWRARWIMDPAAAKRETILPRNGYHGVFSDKPDSPKWVALDLGRAQSIDAVRLWPARPVDWQPDTPGFLFPLRFKIEVAQKADWSDAKTVVDRTAADVPNPGAEAPVYRFAPVKARRVRLSVTKLRVRDGNNYGLALAEMQVLAGDRNLAHGATPTASDSLESNQWANTQPNWSLRNLNDGQTVSARTADVALMPATMLRREFSVANPIRRATVYATARGVYELRINGRRVGDQILAPEWTEYDKRIQYQTYDVTSLVKAGANAIAATLADGWYAGRIGLAPPPGRYCYGPRSEFLAQLEIETEDGLREVVATDASWKTSQEGPIRYVDILDGEFYDARREMPGWDSPGFGDSAWKAAAAIPLDSVPLVWQRNEPIRVVRELKAIKLTEPKPGTHVFDVGQNMVGWCRMKVRGPAGAKVTFRHAEMLNDDGTIYVANLRGAPQVDTVHLRGGEDEFYEPHFTYHGFRYVEVTGLPARPKLEDLVGRVFCSASPDVGQFTSSNELINRLMQNIVWTQRANMESVPTDCPQRDERLGWMGDIQAFSQTAIFNMDMAGFFSKWIVDVRDAQLPDGRYPNFAPRAFARGLGGGMGVPAWADAGTVVPWRMYVNYGDRRLLEEHFESAKRWVEYVRRQNPTLLWVNDRNDDYNDWLNGDTLILEGYPKTGSAVPNEVHATAFFAHSAELVAKMAKALGREEDARKHDELFRAIRTAFNQAYVAPDGRVKGDTQAGYALALHFNLLDEPHRPKALEHMLAAIQRYKGHVSTGIQATHRMMLELSESGRHDEACRLVNLRTIPSWGYMIDQGGTTIWERWDGYAKGRGFQNPGMNSFNHWALGSVGEWVWREIAGIQPDEDRPGYQHFTIRPRPAPSFTWVRARHDSIRGPIESAWKLENGRLTLDVVVPPNTAATIFVPTSNPSQVTESGKPAGDANGVKQAQSQAGFARFEAQSGRYSFSGPF